MYIVGLHVLMLFSVCMIWLCIESMGRTEHLTLLDKSFYTVLLGGFVILFFSCMGVLITILI